MNGTAPTVVLALDSTTSYAAGAQVVATATVHDPDTRTEVLNGTDQLGVPFTETIAHTDTDVVVWSWKSTGVLVMANANPISVPAPAVSDVLVCTVTDSEGNVTIAEIAVAVQDPTLLGTTTAVNGAAPAWAPQSDAVRVYTPQGKGLFGWASAPMIAAMKQHPKMIILSMKDAPTPPLLNPVINNVPAGVTLVLIFHHEPDQGVASGDPSAAQYKADWTAGAAIVNALPAAKRKFVKMCEDFTEYAQTHGKEAWSDFWTGLADYCAVDIYTDAISTTAYPAADAMFALLIAVSKATGKPALVPEYGAKRIASDADGSGCAAMIVAHVAYARAHGIVALIWWSSSTFALDARPAEQKTWKNLALAA